MKSGKKYQIVFEIGDTICTVYHLKYEKYFQIIPF